MSPLRPQAVPLVACDPYFSIWSPADKLTDAATIHWTGKPQPLTSLVRIDGKSYRLMGTDPKDLPALPQTSLEVLPTRTIYTFAGAGIRLTLTFTTPALPEDVALLSRPVTYLTWEAHSSDDAEHEVSVYFDSSMLPAVNTPDQKVVWSQEKIEGLVTLRAGTKDQPILQTRGDDLRINWGYLYVAAATAKSLFSHCLRQHRALPHLPRAGTSHSPTLPAARPRSTVLAVSFSLGKVGAQPVSRWLIFAYDDIYSIQYFKKNLRPHWRKIGWRAADLLKASAREYPDLMARCRAGPRDGRHD